MSFVSTLKTSQLPEKPWRTDAVARFCGCVLISMLIFGAVAAMVFHFSEIPHNSSPALFIAFATAALVLALIAIVTLIRSRPNEDRLLSYLIVLMICIY